MDARTLHLLVYTPLIAGSVLLRPDWLAAPPLAAVLSSSVPSTADPSPACDNHTNEARQIE